jgi:hypothetical protein
MKINIPGKINSFKLRATRGTTSDHISIILNSDENIKALSEMFFLLPSPIVKYI